MAKSKETFVRAIQHNRIIQKIGNEINMNANCKCKALIFLYVISFRFWRFVVLFVQCLFHFSALSDMFRMFFYYYYYFPKRTRNRWSALAHTTTFALLSKFIYSNMYIHFEVTFRKWACNYLFIYLFQFSSFELLLLLLAFNLIVFVRAQFCLLFIYLSVFDWMLFLCSIVCSA